MYKTASSERNSAMSEACSSCAKLGTCTHHLRGRCRFDAAKCKYCHCEKEERGLLPLIEVIEVISGTPRCIVYDAQHVGEAATHLRSLPPAVLRLDLHGVTDLFDPSETIRSSGVGICVISYVGLGRMREVARNTLLERIANNQVDYAVLVFSRGGGKKGHHSYTSPGSKAWVNMCLSPLPNSVFIDDGKDHILSTESLSIAYLTCVLVSSKAQVVDTIERITSTESGHERSRNVRQKVDETRLACENL